MQYIKRHVTVLLLDLGYNLVKTIEKIMEKNTAGFAVDIMSIASLPVLFQVTSVLHHLKRHNTVSSNICRSIWPLTSVQEHSQIYLLSLDWHSELKIHINKSCILKHTLPFKSSRSVRFLKCVEMALMFTKATFTFFF